MDLSKLKEPFPYEDIEWRLQQADKGKNGIWGKCLAYVTNRAICNRLDEVVGPENWKNEFKTGPDGGVLCGLSIKVDGEWVTKFDGSENTNIEAVKGGLSGAGACAAAVSVRNGVCGQRPADNQQRAFESTGDHDQTDRKFRDVSALGWVV